MTTWMRDSIDWAMGNPTDLLWVVAAVAVVGGIVGFKRSLDHCKGSKRMRVL